jgi:hypothetical protein
VVGGKGINYDNQKQIVKIKEKKLNIFSKFTGINILYRIKKFGFGSMEIKIWKIIHLFK